MLINQALIEITNFEIYPSEEINNKILYFPEVDPLSLNFQECGIESRYFLIIMGLQLYIMLGHFALLILYSILALANHYLKLQCLGKVVNCLKNYLFWNGFLRLYMELYQSLCLASVLNTYTAEEDWNSAF